MSLSMSMVSSPDDFVDAVEDFNESSNTLTNEDKRNADGSLSEGMSRVTLGECSQKSSSTPTPRYDRRHDSPQSPTPGIIPATPSTEMTVRSGAEKWRHSPSTRHNSPVGTAPELQRSDPTPPGPMSRSIIEEERIGNGIGSHADSPNGECGEAVSRPRYSTEDIDAILEQLNVLESEYEAQVATLKGGLRTKETILRALGDQIADSNHRSDALIEQIAEQSRAEERLREEAALGSGAILELRDELVRMEDEHERILEEQTRHWKGEVMKAEEAVKAEAERQFADANSLYIRLQAEHEKVTSERDALAEEARKASALAAREGRKAKGRETELLTESAELRAALAAAEAQVAVEKRARIEETRIAEEREVEAQGELVASRKGCLAMQHSLAAVVVEKETLSAENRDLKEMAEELMAIVEGGGEGVSS